MKIGRKDILTLDVAPLLEVQWTGIPVFTRRLVQALMRTDVVELQFCCRTSPVSEGAVLEAIRMSTGISLRDEIERSSIAYGNGVDYGIKYLSPTVKSQFSVASAEASTVHDMSTLFMPDSHEEANVGYHLDNFAAELASNEVTFCVSEATAIAVRQCYPSAQEKLRIIYQYVDWPEIFGPLERNLSRPNFGRYAAVIGTLEPRKNLALLLAAMDRQDVSTSQLKFVVIGRKGWLIDEFLDALPPTARDRIIFSGFVSEFTKYRLLKHCEFLVYPSLYEGFGIPAVEAMSLGKPVLASLSSSLPEVILDAGIYFDPFSPEEFAAGLARIQNQRENEMLSRKALARSAYFSWEIMAEPVLQWVRC